MNLIFLKKEILLFFIICINLSIYAQENIIINGDEWDYYDKGYLDNDWAKKLDSYIWKKGKTPLGYGDEIIKTKISYGADEENKELVEYFKKEVTIKKGKYFGFEFRLLRDDGAVIYVNGKQLYLSNMQNSFITKDSETIRRISGEDELKYHVSVFDSSIFKDGKNTIAVAVFQRSPSSSDLIFSLEVIGHNSSSALKKLADEKDIANRDLQYQLKEINLKFQLEKINSQNEILKSSNSNLKSSIFIISILILLSLGAIYYGTENFKGKIHNYKSKIEKIREESLEKDKEMIYLSSKLLNNKQHFKELRADVKGIKTSEKSEVNAIISNIDKLLKSEEEWNTLKKHFAIVYSGFFDNLLQKHPELSESELRHCMFIKLHMQTKEIARLLLIDPRSVQTTRYRIKKKMNLNEEIDLRDYLLKI